MNYLQLYKDLKKLKEQKVKQHTHKVSTDELMRDLKLLTRARPDKGYDECLTELLSSKDSKDAQTAGMILLATTMAPGFWINFGGKQANHPNLSAATPLVPYAFKLYKGYEYNNWMKFDERWLGIHFAGLHNARKALLELSKPIEEEINGKITKKPGPYPLETHTLLQLRADALIWSNRVQPPTSYNMVAPKNEKYKWFDRLPKCVRYMLLQTWMCNVEHRTKYMILDPLNWDNMPEAIDEKYVAPAWEALL